MNKYVKIIALVLVCMLAATFFVGCGKKTDTLTKVKESGKLVLGTSADYPPYEFHATIDGKDTIVGFDIAIAQTIADELGVALEIVDMDFDGLLPAMQTGNLDIVIAGMSANEERLKAADFSIPYYTTTQHMLIRKADFDLYPDIASFKGDKIGAQLGTIQAGIAEKQFADSQLTALSKFDALVLELMTGKINGIIVEYPVADNYIRNYPELVIADFVIPYESEGVSVAAPKGSDTFIAEINKILQKMLDDGTISKLVVEANELSEAQTQGE